MGCSLPLLVLQVGLCLCTLLGLVSCEPERHRADLVFLQSAEPETIDPALASDQVSMRIATSLFEGLCRVTEDGRPEPGMAERWDISEDQRTYIFHLRQGVKWSDGEPVTANDFVQSWRRALLPETGSDYATLMHVIQGARAFSEAPSKDFTTVGVRALDSRTLRVELENPTPYFIDLCAFVTFSPVPNRCLERYGSAWMKPANIVTNGSYRLEDWRLDDRILLHKNADYWDASNVRMRTVEVRPVQDANTALSYFYTGQCDLMMDKGMVSPSLTQRLKKEPWFHTGPFLGSWFIRVNVTQAPFDDARVRQAFAYAVDRRRIVEKITQLGEPVATSMTPPGTGRGFQPPSGLPDYQPEKARQLMADAGYPSGRGFPRVEYLYIPLPIERSIAIELQSMWQEALGVTVSLVKQEQKVWLKSMRELSYQLCRSSWVGDYNDPSTFLDLFTSANGQNRTGFKNNDYDALMTSAAAERETQSRLRFFQQAESLLVGAQAAVIPVYHYVGVQFYHHDRLAGLRPNLIDDHPFRCMRWR
jgi:oligopeptide transport system substrate-binding protein